MPAARASSGEWKATFWPFSLISPASGIIAPESARISEDLPAPLSPITARISPGSKSKSALSMTSTLTFGCRCSCRHLPDPLIECNRDDDQPADGEFLPQHVDAGEREPVAEHADDQGTDQRADDRAAPAEQAGAADHNRRDAVEIGGLA